MRILHLGVVVVLAAAGCAQDAPTESEGRVAIALTSSGPGGATYRLPAGTSLFLSNDQFFDSFSLDGNDPSIIVNVPGGEYSVRLLNSAGHTREWPLTRESGGTTQTVTAVLELPPSIIVTDGQTSPLAIRFHISGIPPIVFSVGSVDVTMSVDETAAPSSLTFALSVSALDIDLVEISETAPLAFPARVPATGDTAERYQITMRTAGPWFLEGANSACAPTTGSYEITGNAKLASVAAEAPPSDNDRICILQLGNSVLLSADFFRGGDALTPLLADLGAETYFVNHGVSMFFFDTKLLNGSTLNLGPLLGAQPSLPLVVAGITADDGRDFDDWYWLNAVGVAGFTLTANP